MTLDSLQMMPPGQAARDTSPAGEAPVATAPTALLAPAPTRAELAETEIRSALASGRYASAFELIRAAHGPAIHRLARRMMEDNAMAEDVVQESLLRIHQGLPALRGGSVRAWVLTVVAHCAYDELRRRSRRRRLLRDDDDPPEVADTGPLPLHSLVTQHELRLLKQCVDALPPTIRAPIALYFGEGLTFKQVAAILQEKDGTIQVRVSRALVRLRKQLHRRGVAAPGRTVC